MSARDQQKRDPEEAAMIEESRRLIEAMDSLIRRAKVLQLEHRRIVVRIAEKRKETSEPGSE